VTGNVPAPLALPVAVSCVPETKLVVRAAPFSSTTAPETKLLPVTVSVKLPTLVAAGEIPANVGVAFHNVTVLEPDLLVSAALVAVTVTVFGEGKLAGAL
jgi:hypothetical protein